MLEPVLSTAQLDYIAETKAFESFMAYQVFQENVKTPFESSFSRDLLDGARPEHIVDEKTPGRQKLDREKVDTMVRNYLFRPTRGVTDAVKTGDMDIPYRSPLTDVLKDFIRGSRTASLKTYHAATRFASPIAILTKGLETPVVLYAHLMCERWALEDDDGKIQDPRSYNGSKGHDEPYELDSRYILTIRMPDLPYLAKMFAQSHYDYNQKVQGAMHFRDMEECEYFYPMMRALELEVQNENPKVHPAMAWGGFSTSLGYRGNVIPMSPLGFEPRHRLSTFGSDDFATAFASSPTSESFLMSGSAFSAPTRRSGIPLVGVAF